MSGFAGEDFGLAFALLMVLALAALSVCLLKAILCDLSEEFGAARVIVAIGGLALAFTIAVFGARAIRTQGDARPVEAEAPR